MLLSRLHENSRRLFRFLVFASFSIPLLAQADIVLDNGQPGTSSTGSWKVSGGVNPYGANSLYSNQNGDRYTFTLNLAPGEYQVYAWWTEFANRRTSVPYDVNHLGGTATVTVNQQQNGGQWNLLGTWSFGSSATVNLRSLGNGTTSADAIRLVPVVTGDATADDSSSDSASSGDTSSTSSGDGSSTDSTISNVSPLEYELGELREGQPVYIDRSYTFNGVPSEYVGSTSIKTANDDKTVTGDSSLSFTTSAPLTVYVGYDVRLAVPSWLGDWIDTGQQLSTTDTNMRLYRKDFPAGTVLLGANNGGGSSSMYSVFVTPTSSSTGDTSSTSSGDGSSTDSGSTDTGTSGNTSSGGSTSGDSSSGSSNTGTSGADGSADNSSASTTTLTWLPPTTNVDGTALSDLGGYEIYVYVDAPDQLDEVISLNNPGLSTYVIEGLAPGTYYFTVAAFDFAGNLGPQSNMASKVIQEY